MCPPVWARAARICSASSPGCSGRGVPTCAPSWVGGLAIGAFVLVFLLRSNKLLGVSTGYVDACSAITEPEARTSWRLPFLGGIVLGGAVAAGLSGTLAPSTELFSVFAGVPVAAQVALFAGGGALHGFGARLAGGCTSGHAIVGTAQLARSSLVATAAFMVAGFTVANLILRPLGA